MKRYFWILAAALVSLAACDKNELQNGKEEESDSSAVAYIRAIGGDDASKAFIDNTTAAFTWSTGDTIAVYTTDGYKISDGLASTYNGTNAATFSFSGANAVTEANRADFAFYPASLVHGSNDGIKPNSAAHHTATDLVVRLRDKYSLSEVSGDKAPTPMIATNDPNGDLSFKALCPLIRFTVRNIPKQTHSIDFKFDGETVSGEFIIASTVTPGTSGITKAGDSAEVEYSLESVGSVRTKAVVTDPDVISVINLGISAWVDQLVINLPVPIGDYGKITITARDNGGDAILSQTVWPNGTSDWTGTRKASKKLTVSLPVFSLGANKKGIFAPGNLLYDGSWHFLAGQYNILGAGAQADNNRDLFGWGTGTAPNETSTDDATYSAFNDWGANVIDSYAANTWRTPTDSDWAMVFATRSTANKFVPAVIQTPNRYGILIFPDDYTAPAGLSIAFSNINDNSTNPIPYTSNMISDADWLLLESVGCVFLPYAGEREGTTAANYSDGVYWSSTTSTATSAATVFFQSASFGWNNPVAKHRGVAVRLVRDLN